MQAPHVSRDSPHAVSDREARHGFETVSMFRIDDPHDSDRWTQVAAKIRGSSEAVVKLCFQGGVRYHLFRHGYHCMDRVAKRVHWFPVVGVGISKMQNKSWVVPPLLRCAKKSVAATRLIWLRCSWSLLVSLLHPVSNPAAPGLLASELVELNPVRFRQRYAAAYHIPPNSASGWSSCAWACAAAFWGLLHTS